MNEKVYECKIEREKGFLYFIDKEGDISRTKMQRGRKRLLEEEKENATI